MPETDPKKTDPTAVDPKAAEVNAQAIKIEAERIASVKATAEHDAKVKAEAAKIEADRAAEARNVAPFRDRMFRVLHTGVGHLKEGETFLAGDLGIHADMRRLIDVGAVAEVL